MTQIVRVVPDVASFAVDDGFAYSVPDSIGHVEIGSIVRVPLSGRTVRGFVIDDDARSDRRLRAVKSVTGDYPVFDRRLLQTLRWAAIHYVSPLGPMLAKASPPNVPRRIEADPRAPVSAAASPLPKVTERVVAGGRLPAHALLGVGPWGGAIAGLAADVLRAGRNVAVVAPSVGEIDSLARSMPFGDRVHSASSQYPARQTTAAWVAAQERGGTIVLGTREIVSWPLGDLGLMLVVEPGRRAMKAPQTPTMRVGDVARRRAGVEGFGLVYLGPVPPAEVVAAGTRIERPGGRVWARIEVVDRRTESAAGLVSEPTRRAIEGVASRGGTVFVFVPRRRDYLVCRSCGEPRRCVSCGSVLSRDPECPRCGTANGACGTCGGEEFRPVGLSIGRVIADLRRSIDSVGGAGSAAAVVVGTERDLVSQEAVDLAVVVGLDAMILAPHYRAGEEGLRVAARVAGTVRPGSGRRCIVETAIPDHDIVRALVAGRPDEAMAGLVERRANDGFPPVAELIALDISGEVPEHRSLAELQPEGASILGPALGDDSSRWLIQGGDLRQFRLGLRSAVHEWREAGRRVRIDVDPIDL